MKHIQGETQTRVQIKGVGSGFVDQETGRESDEPLYIHITGPEQQQVDRAKVLTEDLLLVVRQEHAKAATSAQAHQMELHQAQSQYAQYSVRFLHLLQLALFSTCVCAGIPSASGSCPAWPGCRAVR